MNPDDDLSVKDSRPRYIKIIGIVVEAIGIMAIGLIGGIFLFLIFASGG